MSEVIALIFRYAVVYIIIVCGSIFISDVFKKKTSQTIPISIMLIMVVLYIFGLIKQLQLGTTFVSILYILLAIYSIIKNISKNTHKQLISNIFTSGFYVFTIIFILFAITTFSKMFNVWDEYSYWSIASKNMYYLNDFSTNINSTVTLVYPPIPTILQYFFCKIIGIYSQGIELFASQILGFSLLLPIFDTLPKKRKIALVTSIVLLFAIPAIFNDAFFYYTIYVDALLGILIGYILIKYFAHKKDKFQAISILLAMIMLSLTKPTGVFLAVITLGVLGLEFLIRKKQEKTNFENIITSKEFKFFIVVLITIIITITSWKVFEMKELSQREDANIFSDAPSYEGNPVSYLLKSFTNSFLGINENSNDDRSNITLYYDVFDRANYTYKPLGLSAGTWFLLLGIVSIIIYKYIINNDNKKDFSRQVLSIFIGLFVYIVFLQIAYILIFEAREAVEHNSIQRYIGSYLMAMLYYLCIITIQNLNKAKIYEKCKYILVVGIVLIFTPISPIADSTIVAGAYNNMIKEKIQFDMLQADKIKYFTEDTDRIYPIHQTMDQDNRLLKFRYFMTPIYVPYTDKFDGEKSGRYISPESPEEWTEILYKDYDYVYVLKTDEYFNTYYSKLFKNNYIENWTLYEIRKDNTSKDVLLVPVV